MSGGLVRRSALSVVCAVAAPAAMVTPARADIVHPVITCAQQAPSSPGPGWAQKLPQPVATHVTRFDVRIRSRDGTMISARVYLPDAFPRRKPTVLMMSPYNAIEFQYGKEEEDLKVQDYADCMIPFLTERGYAVVLGDMRGTHNSDGCFDYGGPGDQADGYATVQWIARQKWSNGRVGMYGVSHVGMSQYATAVASPPALKAIIPVAPITSFYRYLYNGGVRYETNMGTPPAYDYVVAAPPPTNASDSNFATNVAGTACNVASTPSQESLDGDFTRYWRDRDYTLMARRIHAAVFHVHGTLDQNVKLDHFTAMWRALEKAGVTRKALIGPWPHGEPYPLDNVELLASWRLIALRWYEHWLHGNDTGMMREPRVMMIDQHEKVRYANDFPVDGARRLILSASGGALTSRPRSGPAAYQDVPGLPRQLLMDTDGVRLRYDSAPLRGPMRLVGEPVVDVVAKIDKTSTHFVAFLYDVAPDGKVAYISRGYLDARHRNGLQRGVDVTPGVVYDYRVRLIANDYVLEKGHRLRLIVASSDNCPWFVDVSSFALGVETCSSSGVVSDTSAAKVTVLEGGGRTSVTIPVGAL